MPDEIRFDGHGFEDLAIHLHAAADQYQAEMTPTMGIIGKELEKSAREIAGQKSEKVAATVRSHTLPGAAVIEAGDATTPIAVLWEVGNRGSKRSATTFRHRVFGRDVWVEQAKFPYLTLARRASRAFITKTLEEAWVRILRRIEG